MPPRSKATKAQLPDRQALLAMAAAHEERAAAAQAAVAGHSSFASRLAAAVVAKGLTLIDLTNKFDKNRDGEVSKMEFRAGVKQIIDNATTTDMDAFFASIDTIGRDGVLTTDELKAALKRMHAKATIQAKEAIRATEQNEFWLSRAADAAKVAAMLHEIESAEAALQASRRQVPIDARFGQELQKRCRTKSIDELVARWDPTINKAAFRREVRSLQLNADNDEIDGLFEMLDSDGGGTLDLDEIKDAFSKLLEASRRAMQADADAAKAIEKLRKAAKVAQTTVSEQEEADQAARDAGKDPVAVAKATAAAAVIAKPVAVEVMETESDGRSVEVSAKAGNKGSSVAKAGDQVDSGPTAKKSRPENTAEAAPASKKSAAFAMKTSAALHALAAEYLAKRDAEDAKTDKRLRPLSSRLGEALVASGRKAKDVVESWAKGGTGAISKMEFRKHVRKLVLESDPQKVDALFAELDDDGGGELQPHRTYHDSPCTLVKLHIRQFALFKPVAPHPASAPP